MSEHKSNGSQGGGQTNGAAEAAQQFAIQQVYLKDASFESPLAPEDFGRHAPREIDLQLNANVRDLGDQHYEVVLSLTVTCRSGETNLYLVEVEQAGLFLIQGIPETHLSGVLNIHCPNILFPFAREVIADLVVKGGFPQLLLNPIDFEHVYREHLAQRSETSASGQRLQ